MAWKHKGPTRFQYQTINNEKLFGSNIHLLYYQYKTCSILKNRKHSDYSDYYIIFYPCMPPVFWRNKSAVTSEENALFIERGSVSVNQTCSWGDYPLPRLVLSRIGLLLEMKQLLDGSWHSKQREERMCCLMLNHCRKPRTLNTLHTPGLISQVYTTCQSRRGKGQLIRCTNVCSSLAARSIQSHA